MAILIDWVLWLIGLGQNQTSGLELTPHAGPAAAGNGQRLAGCQVRYRSGFGALQVTDVLAVDHAVAVEADKMGRGQLVQIPLKRARHEQAAAIGPVVVGLGLQTHQVHDGEVLFSLLPNVEPKWWPEQGERQEGIICGQGKNHRRFVG